MVGLMRRVVVTGMVVGVLALAAPAGAAVTSVTDAKGDYPDILKLTLDNQQSKVVLKMKYDNVKDVMVDTFYIKWGDATHYRLNLGNYDSDDQLEKRLSLSTNDGDKEKSCSDMSAKRISDTDITKFTVARDCLPKAPNKIFAKGVAKGMFSVDETKNTDKVDRG